MWPQHLYQRFVNRPLTRRQVRPQAPRRRGVRVGLEILEDRLTPSNFTAATVSDLIADINAANQAGGKDNITALFVAGPEFLGGAYAASETTRPRSSTTRVRRPLGLWRVALLVCGVAIGMLVWMAVRR